MDMRKYYWNKNLWKKTFKIKYACYFVTVNWPTEVLYINTLLETLWRFITFKQVIWVLLIFQIVSVIHKNVSFFVNSNRINFRLYIEYITQFLIFSKKFYIMLSRIPIRDAVNFWMTQKVPMCTQFFKKHIKLSKIFLKNKIT